MIALLESASDGYANNWVVAAAAGTFYGQAMTAGDIYVVAGNGTSLGTDGLGDGLPATQARFADPDGVAITPSGDLLVADSETTGSGPSAGSRPVRRAPPRAGHGAPLDIETACATAGYLHQLHDRPGCGEPVPGPCSAADVASRRHRAASRFKGTFLPRQGQCLPSDPAVHVHDNPRALADNPAWGRRRVQGELIKRAHRIAVSTVRQILHDAGINPAPGRPGGSS